MGYGVTWPIFGGLSFKVIFLGVLHFVAAEALDLFESVQNIDDLSTRTWLFLMLSLAVLDAFFILWIFFSLSKTLEKLQSFNPMSEPFDEDEMFKARESGNLRASHAGASTVGASTRWASNTFSFQWGHSVNEDDDEVTESTIRAFLDEKALELKKLQMPLYEEIYNTTNATIDSQNNAGGSGSPLVPIKCKSPHSRSSNADSHDIGKHISDVSINSGSPACSTGNVNPLAEITGPILNEWQRHQDAQQQPTSPSVSERQRLWKEELDWELERKREEMRRRLASYGGGISSPRLRQRDQLPALSSPMKVSERQRLWKEELDWELERKREEMRRRLASYGGRISSPRLRQRDQSPALSSPTKVSERQRLWKEELDRELEREREEMRRRLASYRGRISSPRLRQRDQSPAFSSPTKVSERQRLWKEELDRELERKREEMRRCLASYGGRIIAKALSKRSVIGVQ